MPASKIVEFSRLGEVMDRYRADGRKIIHCHGTFDLLHPGHLIHFEEARAKGNLLVVTITGEKHVNKGPGRPYFNDVLRSKFIASLGCVDYVSIVPHPAAVEAINAVRPAVYCKGKEYENALNDVTGNIVDDLAAVKSHGGEVCYVGSVVFSSTRLINRHFDPHPPSVKAFCGQIAQDTPPERFREIVEAFRNLKVLIVGDIIFDRYTTVEVQGLTSKNRILSGRFVEDDFQSGGALAVLRHIREFTPHVKLIGLAGTEAWLDERLGSFLQPGEDAVVRSPDFVTVVKQRFVEPRSEGKELAKLFSINYINRQFPGPALQDELLRRVEQEIDDYDMVLVMDFGHGVMEGPVRELVQRKARFLGVNCQTNSNNHGFNIISRRYTRADAISLDRTEMSLVVGRRDFDQMGELARLAEGLNSQFAWLTRGPSETIGIDGKGGVSQSEPFEQTVVDTLGAGDAFCAIAFLAAAAGTSLPLATFMGQLAGSQAVKIVGNSEPVRKATFLRSGIAMLSF